MLRVKLFRINEFYEPLENIETIIDRFGKVAKIIEEVRDFLSNIIDLEEKTYKERIDKDKNCFWDLGERVENHDEVLLADFVCKMGIYCTPNQVLKALNV